ncbi:thioredoxin family protein [Winogradskyella aurantiaca]|uniref:thioredoxin family protein n=1 Tax=Winogradskyella aurantiaca TaxID=2219558 RepID=UPI000E1DF2F9|nr:thioredoxin family protein [Winogradskyella aurantiaca]
MALTPSNMMDLGTEAPEFNLLNVLTNETNSLSDLKGSRATLIMFICNHCPFVKHINNELSNIGKDYQSSGVNLIAISSNDIVNYPDDAPHKLAAQANEFDFVFPYLFDATQEVARAYDAACTPDFFLFDHQLKLQYRGQLDDSRPGNGIPVSGRDLRNAIKALIEGSQPTTVQKPSIGCNIKWKTT